VDIKRSINQSINQSMRRGNDFGRVRRAVLL